MSQPISYLSFNGNCRAAMQFYAAALDGKIEVMLSGADSPMAAQIPVETAHHIMHARLALPNGGYMYAGDCPGQMPYDGMKGFSLTLNYATIDQANRVFKALADGGNVTMPMQPAFWAKAWGMLTDKFGTPWIVNGESLDITAGATECQKS